ncbi:Gfo/Idh/MocA family protein [Amaricoccus tamworthensis]|uniref:Gfo/Idh/MocA family protein n=1 Tax=Amaricoccus tamworthensis TaxID=57002 RepID=UPI003C7A4398
MTKKTIRYGLIGCGMMGREHIKNINLLPDTQISAILEPNAEMRDRAKPLAPDAVFPGSLAELLALPDLDCLVIASPNHFHCDQLLEIERTRPLPLLVEKPLFTGEENLSAIRALAQTYPAHIWVGMEYRYMPPIAAFLKRAEAVTGGIKMLTIREHRFPFLSKVDNWNRFNLNTGGTFVEKCCHFFDLMRLTLGSEPVRVMASAGQDVNHLDEVHDGHIPDVLDNGYVIADFANGARAMLELCMFAEGSKYQEELSATGPDGRIEAFVPGPTRFWPDDLGEPPLPMLRISPRNPKRPVSEAIPVDPELLDAGDHNGSTFYQHRNFLALVRGETRAPEVSLEDGWRAVEFGIAAQHSAQTHQAVQIPLFS